MRIIHVLHSHGYGGAESHALLMMKGQREAGHEVMFAGPLDSWLGRACAAEGIEAVHIGMHGLVDVPSHWRLRTLARRWRADVVHGHLIRGAMYAGLAGHRDRRPLAVCTAHATTARTHMRRCAHIIAVSAAVRDTLLQAGYAEQDISVIHNGVPDGPKPPTESERMALRTELGVANGVFAVAHTGRFVRDKGQDVLVQALAHAPTNVHLYLIGGTDTPFAEEVKRLAEPWRDRVHFLGYRTDVNRILPAFDAFALGSRREAISLSVIEAFAARLPVVATAVGGVPEIVRTERTGLLVPSEDVSAMGRAWARFSADTDLRRRVAQAGRQYFEQHLTARHMVDQTLNLYAYLLTTRGRS